MSDNILQILERASVEWTPPLLEANIPHGDMPGDKIVIGPEHIAKSNIIFPRLLPLLAQAMQTGAVQRAVVTVCGGSGVEKSEIASLLAYYLQGIGVGYYVLSGDNYPHIIPAMNNAERLRIFRSGGIRCLLTANLYTAQCAQTLMELQKQGLDAAPEQTAALP